MTKLLSKATSVFTVAIIAAVCHSCGNSFEVFIPNGNDIVKFKEINGTEIPDTEEAQNPDEWERTDYINDVTQPYYDVEIYQRGEKVMPRTSMKVPFSASWEVVNNTITDILRKEGFKEKRINGEDCWKKGTGLATAMQYVKVEHTENEVVLYGVLKTAPELEPELAERLLSNANQI